MGINTSRSLILQLRDDKFSPQLINFVSAFQFHENQMDLMKESFREADTDKQGTISPQTFMLMFSSYTNDELETDLYCRHLMHMFQIDQPGHMISFDDYFVLVCWFCSLDDEDMETLGFHTFVTDRLGCVGRQDLRRMRHAIYSTAQIERVPRMLRHLDVYLPYDEENEGWIDAYQFRQLINSNVEVR